MIFLMEKKQEPRTKSQDWLVLRERSQVYRTWVVRRPRTEDEFGYWWGAPEVPEGNPKETRTKPEGNPKEIRRKIEGAFGWLWSKNWVVWC